MFKGVLLVLLFVLVLIFGPLALIWALNTLFPVLLIPYTFETWLAVVVFNMFLFLLKHGVPSNV